MKKQKRGEFNMELKTLLMIHKKRAGVTSIDIAKKLGVSVQTVTQMAGHLDEVKLIDLCKIAELLKTDYEDFIAEILVRSKSWKELSETKGWK